MVWIRFLAGTNSGCSFRVDSYHTSAFSNSSCEGQRRKCEGHCHQTKDTFRLSLLSRPHPFKKHLRASDNLQYFLILNGSKLLRKTLRPGRGEQLPPSPTTTHKENHGRAQEPEGEGRGLYRGGLANEGNTRLVTARANVTECLLRASTVPGAL